MQPSRALTEYHIRRPGYRDLRLDALPAELQDTAAKLLCTIFDAATLKTPGAVEELRKIASFLAPNKNREDPHQRERPLVTQLIERAKQAIIEGEAAELAARILHDGLGCVDSAFLTLEPGAVARLLRLRSNHKIAATLTVDCEAFGELKPANKPAREESIARVAALSLRAASA